MMPRLAVVPELDKELDHLYSRPLEEFTTARNELTVRLRKAGQSEAAETVRALRKPSVAVWAVNQLARRHSDDVRELVAAAERLRHAQAAAMRSGDAASVRAATAAERESLRKLTRLAERLLTKERRAATQAMLERIAGTLRAAAVDPEAAALLSAGRLPDEVESSGFAALAAVAPPPQTRTRPQRDQVDVAAKRRHEQRLQRLRKRVEQLERTAADSEEKADRARADATAAAKELEAAERDAPT
jgi:anion-transporting  ArsA/GET3 family ATPase